MIDASLPLGRALVDMTEMEPRKSLGARQDALADVLERLALRLADVDHMAELAHGVEGAVEHGGAVGIDREIDAFAAGEGEHRRLEILLRGDRDFRGAVGERALFLARRAGGADHPRPGMDGELGAGEPDPAA